MLNEQEKPYPRNCRDKTSCPLNRSFQHKNLVYFCQVSTPDIKQNRLHYIGFTEHAVKDRLYKHNSFKYEPKRNSTGLSNFIWGKKKEKITANLDWSILDKAKPYSLALKKCLLCLSKNLLNKRNELIDRE